MKRSFFDKMFIWYLFIGVICFGMVVLVTNHYVSLLLTTERTKSLQSQAQLIASRYAKGYYDDTISNVQLQEQIDSLTTLLGTTIWITDHNGQFVAASSEANNHSLPVRLQDFPDHFIMTESFVKTGTFHGAFSSNTLSVGIPIMAGKKLKGYIIVHSSLGDLADIKSNILQITYLVFLLVLLLSMLFLYHFTRRVLIPLDQINQIAQEYSNGNFETVLHVDDKYEIGEIADSLNNMADELRKGEEYRKNFIANVSHDFRSPLTSIKGYVEAMLDGTIPYPMQERYLKIVLNETARLSKLTSGLLTLNNFDSNSMILKKKVFDINQMILNTVEIFEGAAAKKNVHLRPDVSDTPIKVYADNEKIKQVIYNLLDNAIKFSPENSSIFITVLYRSSDQKVTVSVKDSGVGIKKDQQKHIWDRFYKADSSRGKDKMGTGLGLSIVKEIMKAHDETITLDSEENHGCNFTFTLPPATSSYQR